VAESTTNAGQTIPNPVASRPAAPAPTTPVMRRVTWDRELAARSLSWGTTCGISAVRAGVKNVPTVACVKPSR